MNPGGRESGRLWVRDGAHPGWVFSVRSVRRRARFGRAASPTALRRRPRPRFATETTTPYRKTVAPLFVRSDVAVIRTSSEIPQEAMTVVCGRGLVC